MLTHLVERWGGPISLALFLPDRFKASLVAPLRAVQQTMQKAQVTHSRPTGLH